MQNKLNKENMEIEIKKFEDIETELLKEKAVSDSLTFNITIKSEEKKAKSHIAKLRKLKKPIVDCHKILKSDILKYGKALDIRKKELLEIVEQAINKHSGPLEKIKQEKEEKEKQIKIAEEKEKTKYRTKAMQDKGFIIINDSFMYSCKSQSPEYKNKIISFTKDNIFNMDSVNFETTIDTAYLRIKEDQNFVLDEEFRKKEEIYKQAKEDRENGPEKNEKTTKTINEKKEYEEKSINENYKTTIKETNTIKQNAEIQNNRFANNIFSNNVQRTTPEQSTNVQKTINNEQIKQHNNNNMEHRRKINREALNCLVKNGIDMELSKKIIGLIYNKKINNITINY